jgi:hypothetical protein
MITQLVQLEKVGLQLKSAVEDLLIKKEAFCQIVEILLFLISTKTAMLF